MLDPNDHATDKRGNLCAVTDTGQQVLLTRRNNPNQFLAKNTLKQRLNTAMQRKLGISDALSSRLLSMPAVAQLQNVKQTLPMNIDSIPLQDLHRQQTQQQKPLLSWKLPSQTQAQTQY